jgi:hypothetical protein
MLKLESDCFLKLPSYDKPFHIATDYSGIGIGGVLMQENKDDQLMPLQFASRSLTDSEKKFPPLEGEALAIIWALDKFRLWTEGHQIILYTDHKPL